MLIFVNEIVIYNIGENSTSAYKLLDKLHLLYLSMIQKK